MNKPTKRSSRFPDPGQIVVVRLEEVVGHASLSYTF